MKRRRRITTAKEGCIPRSLKPLIPTRWRYFSLNNSFIGGGLRDFSLSYPSRSADSTIFTSLSFKLGRTHMNPESHGATEDTKKNAFFHPWIAEGSPLIIFRLGWWPNIHHPRPRLSLFNMKKVRKREVVGSMSTMWHITTKAHIVWILFGVNWPGTTWYNSKIFKKKGWSGSLNSAFKWST